VLHESTPGAYELHRPARITPATIATMWIQGLTGLLLATTAATLAYAFRTLTVSGAVAAVLVGTIVYSAGAIRWSVVLLVFFASASLLARWSRPIANGSDTIEAKSDCRDAAQVLANGGVPAFYCLLWIVRGSPFWSLAFTAAVAAATADTWATELGKRSDSRPVHIVTRQTVTTGTSGGVTMVGFLASIGGACLVAIAGTLTMRAGMSFLAVVPVAGFLGAGVDSLLGATLQEQRFCRSCHISTEQPVHIPCGSPTTVISGIQGLNNDWVNAAASLSGSVLALAAAVIGLA